MVAFASVHPGKDEHAYLSDKESPANASAEGSYHLLFHVRFCFPAV